MATPIDDLSTILISDTLTLADATYTPDTREWQNRLTATLPTFMRPYGNAAAELGAEQYRSFGTGHNPAVEDYRMSPAHAGALVGWALLTETDSDPVERLIGGLDRDLRNAARDTIAANEVQDPATFGWARVPRPDCCTFCALLSTNVYHSQETALFTQGDRRAKRPEGSKYHDWCKCSVALVMTRFDSTDPMAQVRDFNPSADRFYTAYQQARDTTRDQVELRQRRNRRKGQRRSAWFDRTTGEEVDLNKRTLANMRRVLGAN